MSSPEVFGIMTAQQFTFLIGLVVGAFLFYRERVSVCHECEYIDSGHSNYCEECGGEKEQRYSASIVDLTRSAVGTILTVVGEVIAPNGKGDSR